MALKERDFKLLYELSLNSRPHKKELAKRFHISPQLLTYNIEKLNSLKLYTPKLVIDPSKFNLINIKVFLLFTSFETEVWNKIKDFLLKSEYVVFIQEMNLGVDLSIEYSVPNLSFFNKIYSSFLERFNNHIEIVKIYPVFVKYSFSKKYLYKRAKIDNSIILCGDRDSIELNNNSKRVLKHLIRKPNDTIANIAKSNNIDFRTCNLIIKKLINQKIIRKFSIILNRELLNIKGLNIIVRYKYFNQKDNSKMLNFANSVAEITGITKLLGKDTILIQVESLIGYKKILMDLRKKFKFNNYQVYHCGNILKEISIPIPILE